MIVSLIAAIAENNGIGKDNDLLWHLPADMSYFKKTTLGHCVLTGRKNYLSIPEKYRPLTERTNLVVSRNKDLILPGAFCFTSINEGINFARQQGESELFVIGGGEIYRQTIQLADKLYLTRVAASPEADVYFPEIDPTKWRLKSSVDREADDRNPFDLRFEIHVR